MSLGIVILAAGQGTRMKSPLPKVLCSLNEKPMLTYVLDTAFALHPQKVIGVVGYKADQVKNTFNSLPIEWALQDPPLGTGHAIMCAKPLLKGILGDILVLYGDVPAIRVETLQRLITQHQQSQACITLLTCVMSDPTGYGRIIKDKEGLIQKIVEEKDASFTQKKVNEVNTGICVFNASFLLGHVDTLKPNNAQGEYYLTDLVQIAVDKGQKVQAQLAKTEMEVFGINDTNALKKMEEYLKNL